MATRVLVNGAQGRMGKVTVIAIEQAPDFELVGALGHGDDLATAIQKNKAQVVIDFTTPAAVFKNTQTIIENNAHPIIGTTGLTAEQVTQLTTACEAKKLGGIIAPNFALGVILMMKYAQDAAKYFSDAEIIELHHDQKKDAPSGTAIKTAQMMARNQQEIEESADTTRGTKYYGTTIHSVRLPGLIAHQEILFGSPGQLLTIRHDTLDLKAFMPGVLLAIREVTKLKSLLYGLETLL